MLLVMSLVMSLAAWRRRDGNINPAIRIALIEKMVGSLIFGGAGRVNQIPTLLCDAGNALPVLANIADG